MSKRSRPQEQMAVIQERIQETRDTVTLRLKLSDPFSWKPGQFIMVQAMINGDSIRRAYSISSSPTRTEYLAITIRQTETPTMSKYLNEVQEGEQLNVRGPYGRFIWTEGVCDKVILLGAGSGVTPLKAILEYMVDKKLDVPVKFLYTCRYGDNVIFDKVLPELAHQHPNCDYELSLTREAKEKYPEIRKGRINLEYLKGQIAGFETANFYMCGVPGFINAMMDDLAALGISSDQMKREQWG